MKILVACEESQAVTKAFRDRGHYAYSCDLVATSGDNPMWHIQGDALDWAKREPWDMILAFPPCTHLAASGARYWAAKQGDGRQEAAIKFFMAFTRLNCPRIAIENPIGIMSRMFRKPDQIVHPYMFGHPESKATCLWLKGLPLLIPTDLVNPEYITRKDGSVGKNAKGARHTPTQWVTGWMPAEERRRIRSRTFQGIADAMALQWGEAR